MNSSPYKFKWTEKDVQMRSAISETIQNVDGLSNMHVKCGKLLNRLKQGEPVNIQEVTPDAADNSGPIFDTESLKKVQNDDDNYNVFANDREHPEQPESVNDTYLEEQDDLLASLIDKIKCEIDDNKNRNKLLESSNKTLVDKLKAKLDRYHDVNYASKVEIDCAKAKGDLVSYKMESQKSFNEYTRKINDLNQTISEMKKELFSHQETISIMSQEKEARNMFYKTREDKEIEKVIPLENKVKALDDILYIKPVNQFKQ
ncbi:hypothetical protein Tco_1236607 [Tanacetum coccineum]